MQVDSFGVELPIIKQLIHSNAKWSSYEYMNLSINQFANSGGIPNQAKITEFEKCKNFNYTIVIAMFLFDVPDKFNSEIQRIVDDFAVMASGYYYVDSHRSIFLSFNDINDVALLTLLDEDQVLRTCMSNCYYR